MKQKAKLIAKQIPIHEVETRRKELLQAYFRIRTICGDNENAARTNAEALLQRSLATGIIVEIVQIGEV